MPNLLAGNVDAAVVYSPLSFQILKSGDARTIIDYATAVPPNLTAGWIVLDKFAEAKPQVVQKALNALYGAVAFMRANRDATVKLIADLYEMPPEIAALEYENTILKLETDGNMGAPNVKDAVQLSHGSCQARRIEGHRADGRPLLDAIQAGPDQTLKRRKCPAVSRPSLRGSRSLSRSFALWELLSRTGLVNPRLLPSASDTLATLGDLLQRSAVRNDLAVTASEVLAAFAVAVPFGCLIGYADRREPLLRRRDEAAACSSPSRSRNRSSCRCSSWCSASVLPRRSGFGFFSTIFIVIMSTTTAVESVKVDYLTVARSYGATPVQTAFRVYLPSMLPVLLEALRIAMIFNLTGVILAEMYASRDGIGHQIATWGENFQMKQLLAGVVMIAVIAMTFNELMRWVETRCSHWRT